MGSRGSFVKTGGFDQQRWKTVGEIHGVKVLQNLVSSKQLNLPPYSNTPGTAYIGLNQEGKFHQLREYNSDRTARLDIDFGRDSALSNNGPLLHAHDWVGGQRQSARLLTGQELRKYQKYIRQARG